MLNQDILQQITWKHQQITQARLVCVWQLPQLEVDGDGNTVDANELGYEVIRTPVHVPNSAIDSRARTEPHVTVLVLLSMKLDDISSTEATGTYQETPPRTATGVQPVPMGTFRLLISMPSRARIMPLVTESTVLEFWTFWQH
jgi:hypothetical protein